MAIKQLTQVERFLGLSGDTKPTTCSPGSTFLETDTSKMFVFDGSSWSEKKQHIEGSSETASDLKDVKESVCAIEQKDFATETTLAGVAKESTLATVALDIGGVLAETQVANTKLEVMVDLLSKGVSHQTRYGIRIDKNDSNPNTRVEYLYDAIGMEPAKMNYSTGTFDYGSWREFCEYINEPVMLNYDGSISYLLNRSDQTKKIDGSDSDISDSGFGGNAMSKFKRLWIKEWEDDNYEYIVFAFNQIDHTYHAHAFTDSRGNVRDHMYHGMFEGANVSGKLRSIADLSVTASQTGMVEIERAEANGPGWFTNYKSQRDFITYLLWMVSKSTYEKQKYGMGNIDSGAYLPTGTLKEYGQFKGYSDTDKAVKIFYIENFWGNYWKRLAGLIMDLDGQIHTKMTPPYNQPTEGNTVMPEGYTPTGVVPSGGTGGYIRQAKVTGDTGLVPMRTGGSATTYYTAGLWYIIGSTVKWALVGGLRGLGVLCGAWYVLLDYPLSSASSHLAAALSFLENPS